MRNFIGACLLALAVVGICAKAVAQETITGVWQGSYECPQGVTGLTLSIEGAAPAGGLKGNFRFYPTPANTRAARGDYEVAVSFDPASGRFEARGTRWIDQPDGYVFATLRGVLQGTQLIGTVENPGCGAFELTRAER
jgi:hypothetical protein